MKKATLLCSPQLLADEYARCCKDYSSIHLAVAWCGNPDQTLPYKHLENFRGKIIATVGIAFKHTHPEAIEWFRSIGADIKIFRDSAGLFHPKIYLFTDANRYALLTGSSNFTYGGFYSNIEANVLVEGTISAERADDINGLKTYLDIWHSDAWSFRPTTAWLNRYRKDYQRNAAAERRHGIYTPSRFEEEIGSASWLRNADWDIYYQRVIEGLKRSGRDAQNYHNVLDAAGQYLYLPWKASYFEDIERRRIIGGIGKYGWLGHVAASGKFRHLLAEGRPKQWATIVRCLNSIANFDPPIPWTKLETNLRDLTELGFTMKVWGRLLCIVRPDLYCTISSESVRRNLARTLDVAQSLFERPQGYIKLIKLVHASPWFNSDKPKDNTQAAIWARRAAFMDAIFYS